ncbi:MAG: TatD family hydrolase [Clostridia bacterium]|nr:TatD family hydrolase [Clostridia bacterium]
MIIDFHTHIFPDRIAARALSVLKKQSGDSITYTDATLADTRSKMQEWGIDKYVCLNISTNTKQQTNVNNFAIENNSDSCIMFGSVHPFSADVIQELERIKAAGLKGIKLHSEYQNFDATDKRVFPVYEKIMQLRLILVFHGGTDIAYQDTPTRCTPQDIKKLHQNFKDLIIVMAHLGGYKETQSTLEQIAGKDIYLDTSIANVLISKENAQKVISSHGEDFLLFGSDCPWASAADNVKFIDSLKIPQSKKDALFYKNAKRLLKI